MTDTKKLHDEAPAPAIAITTILATLAFLGALLLIGSTINLGNADANASAVETSPPDQIASPEEHAAFIRQGHERAAREGDATPLPPTF
jgi:hypothetical protein